MKVKVKGKKRPNMFLEEGSPNAKQERRACMFKRSALTEHRRISMVIKQDVNTAMVRLSVIQSASGNSD